MKRKIMSTILALVMLMSLAGCAEPAPAQEPETTEAPSATVQPQETPEPVATPEPEPEPEAEPEPEPQEPEEEVFEPYFDAQGYDIDLDGLTLDTSAWNYDPEYGIYWQIGVAYCAQPESLTYETLGIYVPEAYFTAQDNGDGTYTCTVNEEGVVGDFTAATAPLVMPVNTAGYSAQKAPTAYNGKYLTSYMEAGFIYVNAGCRGRDNGYNEDGTLDFRGGAPWGVTDLKAAVRYLRLNDGLIPGDTAQIFAFGHSGGGAQSSILAASGDSQLYYDYLTSIGAAMVDKNGEYISDAIAGAMCWCPITALDAADCAYEWMMGQYYGTNTRQEGLWTRELSYDLAEKYADIINGMGLKGRDGTDLTLEASDQSIYASGSYYDLLLEEINQSLNNFLNDNDFPYTYTSGGPGPASKKESVTYETKEDYIASLNGDESWITYDSDTGVATIASVEDFVLHCKSASKAVGAFDDLSRGQAENRVFGDQQENALHYDRIMAGLLVKNQEKYSQYQDFDPALVEAYQEYEISQDDLGKTSLLRQDMYNPMYYVCQSYEGYGTSNVAPHWRIHSGITQGDTAVTTELNLALALSQDARVENVEFATVWAQGHTSAERTGTSTGNFIQWVRDCLTD